MKPTAVLSSVAAVLALSGCFSAGTGGTAEPGTGPAGASSQPAASKKPAASTAPADTAPKIGDKYKFDDGLAVEITKTKQAKIGSYAAGGKPGGSMAVLTLRVTNGTGAAYDSTLMQVTLAYGKDGDQAERVFDGDSGTGLEGTVAKGRSKSAAYAFAVPKKSMGDVSVEVTPGLEYEPVTFTGSIS